MKPLSKDESARLVALYWQMQARGESPRQIVDFVQFIDPTPNLVAVPPRLPIYAGAIVGSYRGYQGS